MLAACAALALAELGGALAHSFLDVTGLYSGKAFVVCLLTVGVAVGYAGAHPFPRFGAANTTTMIRVALVALLAAAIGERQSATLAWTATALTLLITVLDGVDGWLARRSGLASSFGARFDMETDALLILVLAALAWRWDRAGAWVLACGLMRYAFVAAASPWPWLDRPLPPSLRRKAICVVQIVGLAIVVAPVVERPLSEWLAAATLVVLTYSFLVDVLWLSRQRTRSRTCVVRAARGGSRPNEPSASRAGELARRHDDAKRGQ